MNHFVHLSFSLENLELLFSGLNFLKKTERYHHSSAKQQFSIGYIYTWQMAQSISILQKNAKKFFFCKEYEKTGKKTPVLTRELNWQQPYNKTSFVHVARDTLWCIEHDFSWCTQKMLTTKQQDAWVSSSTWFFTFIYIYLESILKTKEQHAYLQHYHPASTCLFIFLLLLLKLSSSTSNDMRNVFTINLLHKNRFFCCCVCLLDCFNASLSYV